MVALLRAVVVTDASQECCVWCYSPSLSLRIATGESGKLKNFETMRGLNVGLTDKVLGPRTKAALRRCQASLGLPKTRVLDETLRESLVPSSLPQKGEEAKTEPRLKAPPDGNFKKLGSLFQLPEFFPGLGTLYVDPATLPMTPFLVEVGCRPVPLFPHAPLRCLNVVLQKRRRCSKGNGPAKMYMPT
jgi:hypothetical protein